MYMEGLRVHPKQANNILRTLAVGHARLYSVKLNACEINNTGDWVIMD